MSGNHTHIYMHAILFRRHVIFDVREAGGWWWFCCILYPIYNVYTHNTHMLFAMFEDDVFHSDRSQPSAYHPHLDRGKAH